MACLTKVAVRTSSGGSRCTRSRSRSLLPSASCGDGVAVAALAKIRRNVHTLRKRWVSSWSAVQRCVGSCDTCFLHPLLQHTTSTQLLHTTSTQLLHTTATQQVHSIVRPTLLRQRRKKSAQASDTVGGASGGSSFMIAMRAWCIGMLAYGRVPVMHSSMVMPVNG